MSSTLTTITTKIKGAVSSSSSKKERKTKKTLGSSPSLPSTEIITEIEDDTPEDTPIAIEFVDTPTIINTVPKLVFIVPYRDREQQQQFFSTQMKMVMGDYAPDEYKIFYVHQKDARDFNRGAMKNIGFIAVRDKWPNDYKGITLVFNDIDTMPFTKNYLHYETTEGVVKHFYGYEFALGGIVSMKAGDFERVGGFPNYWAWGYEDNTLQRRILAAVPPLRIDRSEFHPIMHKNIYQMKDGLVRLVNRNEYDRFMTNSPEGWSDITQLHYTTVETTGFIDVHQFNTSTPIDHSVSKMIDIRKEGAKPFSHIPTSPIKPPLPPHQQQQPFMLNRRSRIVGRGMKVGLM